MLEQINDRSKEMEINMTSKLDDIWLNLRGFVRQQDQHNSDTKRDLPDIASALVGATRKVEKEQKILNSLRYESMNQRHSDIHEAHYKTLGWVFGADSGAPFLPWLLSKDGIFWIQGKVGISVI
jgi:hypothetical protein